jgi:hypothetical protein
MATFGERIKAYSTRLPGGGMTVDAPAMLVDLVMLMKAGGTTKEDALKGFALVWDETKVEVDYSKAKKDS